MNTPRNATPRPETPQRGQWLLLLCVSPFPGSVLLTLVLVLLGTLWRPVPPLAPGEAWGLALPGALAALVLWGLVVRALWRRTGNPAWRKAGAALALLSALLATPVLALGVMQWVNGHWLGEVQATRVRLDGLSTSPRSKSREPHRWAHLPGDAGAGLPPGKYLLDANHHAAWAERRPPSVTVHHARGLLGARVVAGWSD